MTLAKLTWQKLNELETKAKYEKDNLFYKKIQLAKEYKLKKENERKGFYAIKR